MSKRDNLRPTRGPSPPAGGPRHVYGSGVPAGNGASSSARHTSHRPDSRGVASTGPYSTPPDQPRLNASAYNNQGGHNAAASRSHNPPPVQSGPRIQGYGNQGGGGGVLEAQGHAITGGHAHGHEPGNSSSCTGSTDGAHPPQAASGYPSAHHSSHHDVGNANDVRHRDSTLRYPSSSGHEHSGSHTRSTERPHVRREVAGHDGNQQSVAAAAWPPDVPISRTISGHSHASDDARRAEDSRRSPEASGYAYSSSVPGQGAGEERFLPDSATSSHGHGYTGRHDDAAGRSSSTYFGTSSQSGPPSYGHGQPSSGSITRRASNAPSVSPQSTATSQAHDPQPSYDTAGPLLRTPSASSAHSAATNHTYDQQHSRDAGARLSNSSRLPQEASTNSSYNRQPSREPGGYPSTTHRDTPAQPAEIDYAYTRQPIRDRDSVARSSTATFTAAPQPVSAHRSNDHYPSRNGPANLSSVSFALPHPPDYANGAHGTTHRSSTSSRQSNDDRDSGNRAPTASSAAPAQQTSTEHTRSNRNDAARSPPSSFAPGPPPSLNYDGGGYDASHRSSMSIRQSTRDRETSSRASTASSATSAQPSRNDAAHSPPAFFAPPSYDNGATHRSSTGTGRDTTVAARPSVLHRSSTSSASHARPPSNPYPAHPSHAGSPHPSSIVSDTRATDGSGQSMGRMMNDLHLNTGPGPAQYHSSAAFQAGPSMQPLAYPVGSPVFPGVPPPSGSLHAPPVVPPPAYPVMASPTSPTSRSHRRRRAHHSGQDTQEDEPDHVTYAPHRSPRQDRTT